MRKNEGITLVALIITIIVLLILAGISIGALTGNNSIIGEANKAKVETSIAEEKEILNVGIVQAMGKNKRAYITEENLQKELEEYATVATIRKKLVVTFNESQRSYEVDPGGEAKEYEIINYKDLPIMNNNTFKSNMSSYKANVLSVTTLNKIDIPEEAISFDVSKKQDGGVKAWLVPNSENEGKYDLYIGAEKGINIDSCQAMFKDYSNCVNIDLNYLYTDDVTDMGSMFRYCTNLENVDLSFLNVDKVTAVGFWFEGCKKIKYVDMSNFNVIGGTQCFDGCSVLEKIELGNKVKKLAAGAGWSFRWCPKLRDLDFSKIDTSNTTDMQELLYGTKMEIMDLSTWDTSKVTNMSGMFGNCSNVKNLDLSNFNTNKVTRMNMMFINCNNLKTLNISSFNTSKVINMSEMFRGCNSLQNLNITNIDTSKVTSMSYMFYECRTLTELDVSSFNTEKVTSMWRTFGECQNLINLDISNFNTQSVSDVHEAFVNCKKLENLNLGLNFNISDEISTSSVLRGLNSIQEIKANASTAEWITTNYSAYSSKITVLE